MGMKAHVFMILLHHSWIILTSNQYNDILAIEFTKYNFLDNMKYMLKIIHITLDKKIMIWDIVIIQNIFSSPIFFN